MNKRHTIFIIECISCILLMIVTTMSITSYFITTQRKETEINFYDKNFRVVTKLNKNEYTPSIESTLNVPEVLTSDLVDQFIESNSATIDFYSESFQIDSNYIKDQIKLLNYNKEEFDENDIFNHETDYLSFDEELFHYIIDLTYTSSEIFSNNLISTYASKEYMLGLIDYFGKFFPQVDTTIAKSIANIESGYTARSMLDKNNIFGGLSSGILIPYKTIEYGVYSYLKLLNDGYFSLGLTTVESIGYKYNPVIENGIKMASPSWVEKVNNNLHLFTSSDALNIEELLTLK